MARWLSGADCCVDPKIMGPGPAYTVSLALKRAVLKLCDIDIMECNGASGARNCMFAMRELIRRGGRYGFFSSCCGSGLGVATVIENLSDSG